MAQNKFESQLAYEILTHVNIMNIIDMIPQLIEVKESILRLTIFIASFETSNIGQFKTFIMNDTSAGMYQIYTNISRLKMHRIRTQSLLN